MTKALGGKHIAEKKPKQEETLNYGKSVKDGVIYIHRWSTGWQALQFTDHMQARIWASKNDCRYEHNIPMLPNKHRHEQC